MILCLRCVLGMIDEKCMLQFYGLLKATCRIEGAALLCIPYVFNCKSGFPE